MAVPAARTQAPSQQEEPETAGTSSQHEDFDSPPTVFPHLEMHVWRGIYPSFDFQFVDHPGYNRDRGPVLAPALHLHVEF